MHSLPFAALLWAAISTAAAPAGGETVPPRQQEPRAVSPSASAWRQLFEQDLDHLARIVPTHYIYALHPGGAEWDRLFEGALAQARRDAALVRDYGSYRAVLQRFVSRFQDAHFSGYFNVLAHPGRWPGFTIEYQGGRYVVVSSLLAEVPIGQAVTSCDGRSLNDWMDGLAEFLGGPPGLETTRAAIARQFFHDYGNPFHALPGQCRIGDRDVVLRWVPFEWSGTGPVQPARTGESAPTVADRSISISDFGPNGAWVRIGTMIPMTEPEAAQFRDVIERAPGLRDRDVVVIDVRGNAGGMYNWFMAFLRAFYGQPYADYHARARLEIANTVMVLSQSGEDNPGFSAAFNQIEIPPDPPMSVTTGEPQVRTLSNGARLISMRAPVEVISYPDRPPPSPVRGRVYLLTDYGCGSACLSFVDEMMRFPGVVQIGAETHIDRRSGGWPERFELPSGLAFVGMGRMVREGRRRGENEAWVPVHRFPGNIADTEAVQRWIVEDVLPRDQAREN